MELKEFKVLDHGYLKYIDHMGTEESIVEAARMSTDKGFLGWGPKHTSTCPYSSKEAAGGNALADCNCKEDAPGDEKLLEYLYSHKHMTPFEMCELTIEVQAPIAVLREWHRHRTQNFVGDQFDLDMLSFNELSARYVQMPNLHYLPEPRMQDKKNKQGSVEYEGGNETQLFADFAQVMHHQQEEIYSAYDGFVKDGIAKEVARFNTPVSRYSKMRAKGNLRNWLAFLDLRTRRDVMKEMRVYANAVAEVVKFLYPCTFALYEEYTRYAVTLSRSEVYTLISCLGPESEYAYDELKYRAVLKRLQDNWNV